MLYFGLISVLLSFTISTFILMWSIIRPKEDGKKQFLCLLKSLFLYIPSVILSIIYFATSHAEIVDIFFVVMFNLFFPGSPLQFPEFREFLFPKKKYIKGEKCINISLGIEINLGYMSIFLNNYSLTKSNNILTIIEIVGLIFLIVEAIVFREKKKQIN